MRTAGYCILFIGLVGAAFGIMMLFAGVSVTPVQLSIPLYMIVAGWKLKIYGQGIHPREKTGSESPQDVPQPGNPSRDMPVTPAISEVISQQLRRTRTRMRIIAGGFVALGVSAGAGVGIAMALPMAGLYFW